MPVNTPIVTTFEALEKLKKYCAYCERSQFDVRSKLYSWKINTDASESIICTLIEENFLNEERYAMAFAQGKLRINHWGRIKIKQALRQHHISEPCIKRAFANLDPDEYLEILRKEGIKKREQTKGTDNIRKQKTIQFLIGKGFESELVWEQVDLIFNKQ